MRKHIFLKRQDDAAMTERYSSRAEVVSWSETFMRISMFGFHFAGPDGALHSHIVSTALRRDVRPSLKATCSVVGRLGGMRAHARIIHDEARINSLRRTVQ